MPTTLWLQMVSGVRGRNPSGWFRPQSGRRTRPGRLRADESSTGQQKGSTCWGEIPKWERVSADNQCASQREADTCRKEKFSDSPRSAAVKHEAKWDCYSVSHLTGTAGR